MTGERDDVRRLQMIARRAFLEAARGESNRAAVRRGTRAARRALTRATRRF